MTAGDRVKDRPLREIGGKGFFTREKEKDLLADLIDIAVHTMKDMPLGQPRGLTRNTCLPREDVRYTSISCGTASIADLAPGTKVRTSSQRRKAQPRQRTTGPGSG